jgi:hypothetical protein
MSSPSRRKSGIGQSPADTGRLYYLLRVTGVWVFGEDAPIRYALRVGAMAAVCIVLGVAAAHMIVELRGRPASRLTRHLFVAFGALLMLSLSSWIDIIPRLGPSELLLMLGVSLMLLGVALLGGSTTEMTWTSCSLICAGTLPGIRSKGERNAADRRSRRDRLVMYGVPRTPRFLGYCILAAVTLWSGWIALGVWLGTRRDRVGRLRRRPITLCRRYRTSSEHSFDRRSTSC